MLRVFIRFYEELNDFIRADSRKIQIEKILNHRTTVKDLIESFGVPHTEVDLILVNGNSCDFDCRLNDGDQISVYPVFESFDISGVTRLQQRPLRDLHFIADCHLGTLAQKLRLLGFDVEYDNRAEDEFLVDAVVARRKILLSRDRRLLMRRVIDRGYFIRSQIPYEQVIEVIRRFDLAGQINPFTRCARCNGILERVEKEAVLSLLEPKTKQYFEDFFQCTQCNQVYWQGSHLDKIQNFIGKIQQAIEDKH
ncbi:MAG: Mut7-C RNAse domain-containing protein [Candidatus Rifleibacteriota bacterium]